MQTTPTPIDAVPPASIPTISAIVNQLEKHFREHELSYEWISEVNTLDDADTKCFGARHHWPWPTRDRESQIIVSLHRGSCEGHLIRIDNLLFDRALKQWSVLRLITVKCLSGKLSARRTQAAVEDYLLEL